jgi:hypothetical protein
VISGEQVKLMLVKDKAEYILSAQLFWFMSKYDH